MKSFVLSLVLLLAIAIAGTAPAAAAVNYDGSEMPRRERAASYQDTGTHLQRLRVARASINDSDDYYERSNRWRSYDSERTVTHKRYAKHHRSTRTAKHHTGKHYAHRQGKKRLAARHSERRTAVIRRTTPKSLSKDGPSGPDLFGLASFYWEPQRLATGGWFNPNAMTAAHKTLPFGTRVRVTHLGNGRSVDVKINDRGPYVSGRIIDLSKAAAGLLGMQNQGVAKVKVTVLGRG
jgi:rare lipoprotein A